MANYEIDANLLKPYLPSHAVLDSYNIKIFLSLAGFLFADTKVFGIKIPPNINFEELNLRFTENISVKELKNRGLFL